jgi:hypothetical protein
LNWIINTLPWYQWVILGSVPPLIFLLYFLKLRRTSLEVPSTYLWTKTVEDMHVNDIWQRLRKNLLLLLQLLAVLLLMLSCLRPGCQGNQLAGDRFIFVVDQSASMSATDTPDGSTRLEESKKQIVNIINSMQSTDAAMVISFSDRAVVQQSYTTNRSLLIRKVQSIQQTQRGSDINEALLAASGLANPGRTSDRNSNIDIQVAEALDATLYLFTDGAVQAVPAFSLGNLTPEYRPIGSEDPHNVGITAFSINDQMDLGGQVQIFARLQNSGMEDQEVAVALYVDDELQDARGSVNVAGLGSASLQFDLTSLMSGLEHATPIRLEIEDQDDYLQDNTAHCILNPPRMANVLIVSDYNKYLELVTKTDRIEKIANVQFEDRVYLSDKKYQERAALGFYDLIIYDQCAPEKPPACNAVYWAAIPKSDDWKTNENLETTPIVDSDASHPLLYAVQMNSVNILAGTTLSGPQGSLSLVDSPQGSVMMLGPRGGFEDLVIGFALIEYTVSGDTSINTDWPKKLSFPLFIQNIMVRLGGGARFNATRSNPPGKIVPIETQTPANAVKVKDPSGETTTLLPRSDNRFVFAQTDLSGVYEVSNSSTNEVDQLFAVNLLDRLESDLAVRPELKLGYNEIARGVATEQARSDYWTWLVLLALMIIAIEWYIYNRRVFI